MASAAGRPLVCATGGDCCTGKPVPLVKRFVPDPARLSALNPITQKGETRQSPIRITNVVIAGDSFAVSDILVPRPGPARTITGRRG
jgi:hypothetical protein